MMLEKVFLLSDHVFVVLVRCGPNLAYQVKIELILDKSIANDSYKVHCNCGAILFGLLLNLHSLDCICGNSWYAGWIITINQVTPSCPLIY